MQNPISLEQDLPLRNVRSNIVQSIRAFSVLELKAAAAKLGHHFFYVSLAGTQSKEEVLEEIAKQFAFPPHFGGNFDALYDCMTDSVYKNPNSGFVVVLEQIPLTADFNRDCREQFLDIFRDVSDYWGDRKMSFRCFYSFQ